MTNLTRIRSVLLCLCFLAWSDPRTGLAQPLRAAGTSSEGAERSKKAEASTRFDRGLSLFDRGDNAGALAEFRRVYELIPNAAVLLNIGLVYAAMDRPVEATDALERAIRAGDDLSAELLARAQQVRDGQAERVAEVEVTTNVPATLELDSVEVGKTPLLAPIRVASGSHLIGAKAEGYAPARKEITVAGRTRTRVALALLVVGFPRHVGGDAQLLAAESRPAPPPRPEGSGRTGSLRTWGWVTLSVGGALLLGGGTVFLVNAPKQSEAQSNFDAASHMVKSQSGACHAAGESYDQVGCEAQYREAWADLSSAKTRSIAALTMLGTGGAAVGLGIYLIAASAPVRVTPAVGLGSVRLVGEF